MIRVLLFAELSEKTGKQELVIDRKEMTVTDLKEVLILQHDELAPLDRVMVAVNEEYAEEDATVKEGDTVALIPPVSGG
ncbi:molybdopterin converting factor subunit 1 [Halalkalibacterium ligniniphilum]|uniref:molybdopterin converting factor subunit 1 n=1 Tax=Halalkalibacterium ligniniphilum TaxID=1134413 RepID=UPI0003498079|nr:molybdopterin converting factor subunit 1 [Halalkalibacterium ligniniphilum]